MKEISSLKTIHLRGSLNAANRNCQPYGKTNTYMEKHSGSQWNLSASSIIANLYFSWMGISRSVCIGNIISRYIG